MVADAVHSFWTGVRIENPHSNRLRRRADKLQLHAGVASGLESGGEIWKVRSVAIRGSSNP